MLPGHSLTRTDRSTAPTCPDGRAGRVDGDSPGASDPVKDTDPVGGTGASAADRTNPRTTARVAPVAGSVSEATTQKPDAPSRRRSATRTWREAAYEPVIVTRRPLPSAGKSAWGVR